MGESLYDNEDMINVGEFMTRLDSKEIKRYYKRMEIINVLESLVKGRK